MLIDKRSLCRLVRESAKKSHTLSLRFSSCFGFFGLSTLFFFKGKDGYFSKTQVHQVSTVYGIYTN